MSVAPFISRQSAIQVCHSVGLHCEMGQPRRESIHARISTDERFNLHSGNAATLGLRKNLQLTTHQYAIALTVRRSTIACSAFKESRSEPLG